MNKIYYAAGKDAQEAFYNFMQGDYSSDKKEEHCYDSQSLYEIVIRVDVVLA